MTDKITKLYEVAGIACKDLEYCKNCIYMKNNQCINKQEFIEDCLPFTAVKQLELIKFVSNFKVYEAVIHKNRKWFMCASIGCGDYYESRSESFDQAVAGLIINLWQDLTDDQKQEIKRILQ